MYYIQYIINNSNTDEADTHTSYPPAARFVSIIKLIETVMIHLR